MKLTLTAAALATVLAAPAFAQAPAAQNPTAPAATAAPATATTMPAGQTAAAGGFMQAQTANEWRGSNLIGASVHGPDNASIGSINDVILSADGSVRAVVIGVGGFLGIGQKDVAVPFGDLNVTRRDNSDAIDRINVTYTKEQLNNAPTYAYYNPSKSATTTGSGAATGTGTGTGAVGTGTTAPAAPAGTPAR